MARRPRPAWVDWLFQFGIGHQLQRVNTWMFRESHGRVGSYFPVYGGLPVCLLTTTGRKSGKPRTVPLLYLKDGDVIVLVASRWGTDVTPLWYRNLVADPDVEVQVREEAVPMRARTAAPEEKRAYWPKLVALYAPYQSYQAWSSREIPVVLLTPR